MTEAIIKTLGPAMSIPMGGLTGSQGLKDFEKELMLRDPEGKISSTYNDVNARLDGLTQEMMSNLRGNNLPDNINQNIYDEKEKQYEQHKQNTENLYNEFSDLVSKTNTKFKKPLFRLSK